MDRRAQPLPRPCTMDAASDQRLDQIGLPLNRNFSFRHFREIGIHWKYDRSAREVFDPDLYVFDKLMRSNFSAVQWAS